ncbi:DUF4153 domain-containing protein [Deinococcus planocerae]|uniref:DUF4153 domain-containing protein n=1 Tax=Deinococcus planocerae TaxID=1737569 RepID=UPI000C7F5430|nr:DUF4153 domain-containing protein [Deinococcus planocerae]
MTQPEGSRTAASAPSEAPLFPALPRPKRAALPLAVAAGLAVAAHGLTAGDALGTGVNVVVWVALLVGVLVWALRRKGRTPTREAVTLLGLGLAFAVTFAVWRVPITFALLNGVALLLCLMLGAASLRHPGANRAGVWTLVGTAFTGGLRFVYGGPALLERFPWARVRPARGSGAGRWGVGLLLTVPVLLVFGGLLAGADAGFGTLIARLFDWDLGGVWETGLRLIFWLAFAGGLVYPALLALRPTVFPAGEPSGLPRLGLVEVGLPLAALGALFVVFLGTQLPYFLSGTGLPQGFTFSEYVRRGFGELMAVAFLALGLLLGAHAITREEVRAGAAYRLLNLVVLAPLALVLLSAANRWRLYTLAYGLSEIRVLGAAFLVWVVLALGWFAVTLWRGRLRHFAYPALLLGLGTLLVTTALNPGALIARVNVHRATAGVTNDLRRTPQGVEVWTLLNLGADAVPVIVANLDRLTRVCGSSRDCLNDRATVLRRLQGEYGDTRDLRLWNVGDARARRLVRERR